MNKRTERVKSIFDSDDSDDDNNITKLGMPYCKDDEDEDTKLRKTIEEVCSSLGNENEDIIAISKNSLEEPNEKKETHCSSDSEEDDKNLKKDDTPTSSAKFVIPIIEEIEYNLLSKFCNESVGTSLEVEKNIKCSQFDEVKKNSINDITASDTKGVEIIASIINEDSHELKKANAAVIGVDINMEMENSNVKQLSEDNVVLQTKLISENFVEKMSSPCDGSEVTDCFDSLNDEVMDTNCNNLPILIIKNNSERSLENNIDIGCNQTDISGVSDDKYCDSGTIDTKESSEKASSKEIRKQVNSVPTSKIGDFELELDKHSHDPSLTFDLSNSSQENKVNEKLIISPRPTSPEEQVIDQALINKMDVNLEIKTCPSSVDEQELMGVSLVNICAKPQSKGDKTKLCPTQPLIIDSPVDSYITSTLEEKENEYIEPTMIPSKIATSEVTELKSNIKSTNGDNTPSSEEKWTVEFIQDEEIKSDYNCSSEVERKRKVRVEDVFTDSESETASNCSPIKQALTKNIEYVYDSNIVGPPEKKNKKKET